MQIKKNKKKEELKHDPVMDRVEKSWSYIKENNKLITITSLAVIAAILIFSSYRKYNENRIEKARIPFGKGMSAFSEEEMDRAYKIFKQCEQNHSGAPQALYSQYMRAHIDILNNRYDQAETNLKAVLKDVPSETFMQGQIHESLAEVYDAMDREDDAVAEYKKALDDKDYSYRHHSVRWNLALLNKKRGDLEESRELCRELMSDTSAASYAKKADNLLISMGNQE